MIRVIRKPLPTNILCAQVSQNFSTLLDFTRIYVEFIESTWYLYRVRPTNVFELDFLLRSLIRQLAILFTWMLENVCSKTSLLDLALHVD